MGFWNLAVAGVVIILWLKAVHSISKSDIDGIGLSVFPSFWWTGCVRLHRKTVYSFGPFRFSAYHNRSMAGDLADTPAWMLEPFSHDQG